MDRFADARTALAVDTHLAVIVADATGHIRFWNDGAAAIFGHSAEAVAGHRVDLVVPPAYRDMHWAGFNRAMGTAWSGSDAFDAIEGLHASGEVIALEVLLTPLRNAAGLAEGVFAMFRRPVGSL
jgi:PAS domain S-box-containing protein